MSIRHVGDTACKNKERRKNKISNPVAEFEGRTWQEMGL